MELLHQSSQPASQPGRALPPPLLLLLLLYFLGAVSVCAAAVSALVAFRCCLSYCSTQRATVSSPRRHVRHSSSALRSRDAAPILLLLLLLGHIAHHHHRRLSIRRAILSRYPVWLLERQSRNTASTAFTAVAPHQQAPTTVTPHPLLEHVAKHHRQNQASPSPCRSRGTLAQHHGPKRLLAATQACSTAHSHQLWQRGPPQPPGRLTAEATALTASLFTLAHLLKWHRTCWPLCSAFSWHARICRTSPYRASLATHEDTHATPPR